MGKSVCQGSIPPALALCNAPVATACLKTCQAFQRLLLDKPRDRVQYATLPFQPQRFVSASQRDINVPGPALFHDAGKKFIARRHKMERSHGIAQVFLV